MKSLNKTFIPNEKYKKHNWYVIDCKKLSLGRLATYIVNLLLGKKKLYYYPSSDVGDYIILINIKYIIIKKEKKLFFVHKPGYPGKSLKIRNILDCSSKIILERSIKRMLPKSQKKKLMRKLRFYDNETHLHYAQNPITIKFKKYD